MSYNVALASAREPEKFGRGSVEGLVATEAAINSKEGGSLFPTLLFGIPGTAEMALVLAAWQLHGLDPGPLFMSKHADIAWALIFGLLISNLINSALTVVSSPLLSRIPNIDVRLVSPAVLVASALAVYSIRQNFWDVVMVMLIVVGMLIESNAAYIMLVPLLAPIALAYGIDPLLFGFLFVMNLVVGMMTPPVGVLLFVMCGISKISLNELMKSAWPFIAFQYAVLIACIAFPGIVTWLPRALGY